MNNIAENGTYQLSHPSLPGQVVGYFAAENLVQRWVLDRSYTPPGRQRPRVEVRFTRIDAVPYSDARMLTLHRGLPGSRYIYVDMAASRSPAPRPAASKADEATATATTEGALEANAATATEGALEANAATTTEGAVGATAKATVDITAKGTAVDALLGGKKQIDLGCFTVSQDESAVGSVCVTGGGSSSVERWCLAPADASDGGPGPAKSVKAYRPIGAQPLDLLFTWLDEGEEPSEEHRRLDALLERAGASNLFARCRDRSDPAVSANEDAAQ